MQLAATGTRDSCECERGGERGGEGAAAMQDRREHRGQGLQPLIGRIEISGSRSGQAVVNVGGSRRGIEGNGSRV